MNPSQVERISPDAWLNSHLSVARHYGGCKINGVRYTVCPNTNFLVRDDVLRREARQRTKEMKETKKAVEKS